MTNSQERLETRFRFNIGRINAVVRMLFTNDTLKQVWPFRSLDVRADILRSIVVLLHATFEVILRSHIPRPNRNLSFYSRRDIDKALRLSGIDATPFRPIYPPLIQMAKRRKRIVHEADWSMDAVPDWDIVDDWQLFMWLMAVEAFYYQLRVSFNVADPSERAKYDALRTAMTLHVEFANQLVEFSTSPSELRSQALEKVLVTLEAINGTLEEHQGQTPSPTKANA